MAKPGPAKTPKEILRKRGSWRGEINPDAPALDVGMPDQVNELDDDAQAMWDHTVPLLKDMRVLTPAEAALLIRYCEIWSAWRACRRHITEHGYTYVSMGDKGQTVTKEYPQVKMAMKFSDQMLRMEQEFGLTPAARANVQVKTGKKDSKKSRFFGNKAKAG